MMSRPVLRRRAFLAALLACGFGPAGAETRRFRIALANLGDPARAVANSHAAIAAKVDLLIEYNADAEANAEIARRLAAAAIPGLALVDPLPGAPLYGA